MENNYYQKYLKYKSKYLELKKQLGGTKTCAEEYPNQKSLCLMCCRITNDEDKTTCPNTCNVDNPAPPAPTPAPAPAPAPANSTDNDNENNPCFINYPTNIYDCKKCCSFRFASNTYDRYKTNECKRICNARVKDPNYTSNNNRYNTTYN